MSETAACTNQPSEERRAESLEARIEELERRVAALEKGRVRDRGGE